MTVGATRSAACATAAAVRVAAKSMSASAHTIPTKSPFGCAPSVGGRMGNTIGSATQRSCGAGNSPLSGAPPEGPYNRL